MKFEPKRVGGTSHEWIVYPNMTHEQAIAAASAANIVAGIGDPTAPLTGDTPRTDAYQSGRTYCSDCGQEFGGYDFARELERELNDLRHRYAVITDNNSEVLQKIAALKDELTALRATAPAPKVVEVDGCEECPFNYDGIYCKHPDFPEGNMINFYVKKVDACCPLRKGAITIKLKDNG